MLNCNIESRVNTGYIYITYITYNTYKPKRLNAARAKEMSEANALKSFDLINLSEAKALEGWGLNGYRNY
jgi:hypothetical protein